MSKILFHQCIIEFTSTKPLGLEGRVITANLGEEELGGLLIVLAGAYASEICTGWFGTTIFDYRILKAAKRADVEDKEFNGNFRNTDDGKIKHQNNETSNVDDNVIEMKRLKEKADISRFRTASYTHDINAYRRSYQVLEAPYLDHAALDSYGYIVGGCLGMFAIYTWKNPRNDL